METYFLEYLPNEIVSDLMQNNADIDIIALTPKACYELDLYEIEYQIPEDYYYPQRIDIEETYKDEVKIGVFALHVFEREETEECWREFINVYTQENGMLDSTYYGDQLLLKGILLKENNVY